MIPSNPSTIEKRVAEYEPAKQERMAKRMRYLEELSDEVPFLPDGNRYDQEEF